ncbi:MAG: DUF3795 domain-containing protein [Dehalococcoidales bacterium]|nr:MAG: DUF3795 domain-containing protein [Dehalococcoidales bacterium]
MTSNKTLIAPCGLNCGICHTYLREKNTCPGCYYVDDTRWISISRCTIRKCETWKTNESGFCYECDKYPCKRLKQLDKRYITKYGVSALKNLDYIRENGLSAFEQSEHERWLCQTCGGTICVHKGYCLACRK